MQGRKGTSRATAFDQCADPVRARRTWERLAQGPEGTRLKALAAAQRRPLLALLSGSESAGELLVRHPEWIAPLLDPTGLEHPRTVQGLRRELNGALAPLLRQHDHARALCSVRAFKQREMVRIATRDLARFGTVQQVTREISDVADVCLSAVHDVCREQLLQRYGQPHHRTAAGIWTPTGFCVVGLGKLGGRELNYSSDVDVVFVYADEGQVLKASPKAGRSQASGIANHQFFRRLAEAFIAEVSRLADAGMLYRIDLRLRPEGDQGPVARSLPSYESYYAQYGQIWERMMLLKARCVAGDAAVAGEFLEMIQAFRYPRFVSESTLQEIAAMKRRLETEVVRTGELDRNVKLGRGGIREIEFIAQSLQLLHGGRMPFLQGSQTLPTLEKLSDYNLLSTEEARALGAAYRFLRDVEHRLQMDKNLQTHTIPDRGDALERLAALMGCGDPQAFETARHTHTSAVRNVYRRLFLSVDEQPSADGHLPVDVRGAEGIWSELLAAHGFRDPSKAVPLAATFIEGPGYTHVSMRTSELARRLFGRLLSMCPQSPATAAAKQGAAAATPKPAEFRVLSDPDRVLARLDTFVGAYGARATLYEAWNHQPARFELMLWMFDRSEFLAATALRTPDLLDELYLSGQVRRRKTTADVLADLRHGRKDTDQKLWLRRYRQADLMRIGLRDIAGLATPDQTSEEITALGEACIEYALGIALKSHRLQTRRAPIAVIGLGKFGGRELSYGSDLDVVFVAEPVVRDLPRLQRVAAMVLDLLTASTELGVVFELDARLRPDGDKGLLVNILPAYEDYYRKRAMLWEIQALSRARLVAGNAKLGAAFESLAARLADFSAARPAVAAYRPDWRNEIARMRTRIEHERTPPGQRHLAIKTGVGGMIDAEFLAQMFCLAHGWHEPNTLRALGRARDSGLLDAHQAAMIIDGYTVLQRIERILRRWSLEGESVLPADPAPQYRVAVRCGLRSAQELLNLVDESRRGIRSVYQAILDGSRQSPVA
jgi:glutamate-ammonia-ligase adenylyltransferase